MYRLDAVAEDRLDQVFGVTTLGHIANAGTIDVIQRAKIAIEHFECVVLGGAHPAVVPHVRTTSGRASRTKPEGYNLVLDPYSNTAPSCKRYVFQIREAIGLRGDACHRMDNVFSATGFRARYV